MAISWVAGARQWLGKKARRSSVPNQEGEYGREAPEFFSLGSEAAASTGMRGGAGRFRIRLPFLFSDQRLVSMVRTA